MALIEGIKVDGSFVKDTFEGIGNFIGMVRSAFTGEITPEKKAELLIAAAEADVRIQVGQIEINKAEASNPSVFVSGWRPAVGWVCVISLFYNYVAIRFIDYWVRFYLSSRPDMSFSPLPVLDTGELTTILIGMLGLGVMRTVEKGQGTARS